MYDYIIVGAGSAGCVLAKRLSANPDTKVLLLEAGGNDWNPFIHMPAGVSQLIKNRWTNWYFDTQPEPEMGNRRLYWPRGKVLGGSSAINGMIYIRGHRKDYDRWAQLPGCEGWGYDSVLPWFKRSERFEAGANAYHGDKGELGVSPPKIEHELVDAFLEAGQQAGFPANTDFNGAKQEGIGFYDTTVWDGVRQSTGKVFLSKDVRQRSNLTILTHARAAKVLFQDGKAIGVEYIRRRHRHAAHCKQEVLLTAGSVQSPQLLMLSGIGPDAVLREQGIEPLKVLSGVGENLQDHLDASIQYYCSQPITLYKLLKPHYAALTLLEYLMTHKGMGTTNGVIAGGFLKTPLAGDEPDIQLHYVPVIMVDHLRQPSPGHGYMTHVCQLRPKSRGRIRLKSADPLDDPLIEARYLSDPYDVKVMVEAVKLCRELFAQTAFDDYRGDEYMPGAEVQTDEQIADFVRDTAETIYHPVGTCRMGAASDSEAVVNNRCQVHGVEGLRVVDASVFPELMGGNTNAPTILVAERMAADIVGS